MEKLEGKCCPYTHKRKLWHCLTHHFCWNFPEGRLYNVKCHERRHPPQLPPCCTDRMGDEEEYVRCIIERWCEVFSSYPNCMKRAAAVMTTH